MLAGDAAVRHALEVAVGRDSVVAGEDQVLHQLRRAVALGRERGGLDAVLERLFSIALRAGREARSWRPGSTRSLADVALEAIGAHGVPIHGAAVLVVGAGSMGRVAARAVRAAGGDLAIASRTEEAARDLGDALAARTVPIDPGTGIGRYAAVIVALAGPWQINRDTVRALGAASTRVVDLSVPLAIPDSLRRLLGDRLRTADDLARATTPAGAPADPRYERRVDALIETAAEGFQRWLDGRAAGVAASELQRMADTEREVELAALWRRIPDLDPDARAAIDGMARNLTDRLLREPLEQLGRDRDGRAERAVREAFSL
jgi:glutamyl-tRNA reductase